MRDILLWVEFMNKTTPPLLPSAAFLNGGEMIFMDSLGCGGSCDQDDLKRECMNVLKDLCEQGSEEEMELQPQKGDHLFGIRECPFYIEKGTK